jgi:hypothetical protein
MANSIGGGFNIPGQKAIQPNRNTNAPKGQEEVSAPGAMTLLLRPFLPTQMDPNPNRRSSDPL